MNIRPAAQAIVLLSVPFGNSKERPLSAKEWSRLSDWLSENQVCPSALLGANPESLFSGWMDKTVTVERIFSLLGRGGALGFALEKWHRAGLWTVTQADEEFPNRLFRKLPSATPPVLFGCGNKNILETDGIAVVGSRNADRDDCKFSHGIGRMAAEQGVSIVSGGARGVDQESMLGSLEHGGTAVGVVANSLLKTSTTVMYRNFISSGKLVLISPFNPEAGFHAGNAMARNKYIYCMSRAAVVVSSTPHKGGTWSGAIENLRSRWVPLWVRDSVNPQSGNPDLVRKGARPLPAGAFELATLWEGLTESDVGDSTPSLQLDPRSNECEVDSGIGPTTTATLDANERCKATSSVESNADEKACGDAEPKSGESDFFDLFLLRLGELTNSKPKAIAEISDLMGLEKSQVRSWLKRGQESGKVEKLAKPVRYRTIPGGVQQASLI